MHAIQQVPIRIEGMGNDPNRSQGAIVRAIRVIRRSRSSMAGIAIILGLVIVAALSPIIAPHNPTVGHLPDRTQSPSLHWLLGTDQQGRDIFSRILWGARLSLVLGVVATSLALLTGTTLGLVAGYLGGWIDTVSMRAVDILLAFPLYLVALVVVAILGPSFNNTIVAVAVASSPIFARLARGEALALRDREFVEAARALGVTWWGIIIRHILPNILSPLMVVASLTVGNAILVEASLSFLGLGPSPPTPSWGLMINDGLQVMRSAPWVPLFPGLAISLTVLGCNLLGDGIRDALDPRQRST